MKTITVARAGYREVLHEEEVKSYMTMLKNVSAALIKRDCSGRMSRWDTTRHPADSSEHL